MPTQQLILIAASSVYLVVIVITAYFTRATKRRVTGGLIGGAAVGLVGVGVESLAHAMGWWRYPFVETPYGPPLMYPVVILLFAALALIGWRITRRFGWQGQAVFLWQSWARCAITESRRGFRSSSCSGRALEPYSWTLLVGPASWLWLRR